MSNKKLLLIMLSCIAVSFFCSGCESYAQKKQAAHQRWEKMSAKANVSVVRDLFENNRINTENSNDELIPMHEEDFADF